MKVKHGVVGLVIVAIAGAVAFMMRPTSTSQVDNDKPTTERKSKPRRKRASPLTHWEPYAPTVHERDPAGSARLEGQVIDSQDLAVGQATVTINSRPPRTTTTEDDGSFVFENLVPRQYKLRARAGSLIGGPVKHHLRTGGDPAIIRMRPGVSLEVLVVDAQTQQPLAGATVAIDQQQQPTDQQGKARFPGVSPGYVVLAARAEGYALSRRLFEIADNKTRKVSTRVSLSKGASVSGVVSDSQGQPIAGASVRARNMATAVVVGASPIDFVKTNEKGEFTIPSVAAGVYRILAHKEGFAPAQSAPLSLDGKSSRRGVSIVISAGVTLSGKVLTAAGAPAIAANVKAHVQSGSYTAGSALTRRVVTDQTGAFVFRGLPKRGVDVMAYSEQASSKVLRFDLAGGSVKDAELRLSVVGAISGIVVNEAGEGVPEVQVRAVGDFWAGATMSDLKMRGTAEVMTDGAGNFSFAGLPDGKYRLRASRTLRKRARQGPGAVSAKVGDTNIKIVLTADGGAKGRLAFANGDPVTAYTVNVGYPPFVPVVSTDGGFSIADLRPGKYDLTFSGGTFTTKIVRNVQITAGKVTDLGTVKVGRGRSVTGRVVNPQGQPVADATVILGTRIVGDGEHLALDMGLSVDQSLGLRRAASDANGDFRIDAVGAGAYVIAAEHKDHGRSKVVALPAGEAPAKADLRLRSFGSVSGKVKLGDAPAANVSVIANGGESRQVLLVNTASDGAYTFSQLPAGKHTITAMSGQGASASTGSASVVIVAGKAVTADITIEVGEIDLDVSVRPKGDKPIDTTQVFLFSGSVNVTTGGQISKAFVSQSKKGTAKMVFVKGAKAATFAKIKPGAYSICALPITGDLNDPVFAQRLQAHAQALKVYCQPQTVAAQPAKQAVTLTLPAMEPLPEAK